MKSKLTRIAIFTLSLYGCSNSVVSTTTVRLHGEKSLPRENVVRIEGIHGVLGEGIATAICGVDEYVFDPCVLSVELLPGQYAIHVREIAGKTVIRRSYTRKFKAGSQYIVGIRVRENGSEEPVIVPERESQ